MNLIAHSVISITFIINDSLDLILPILFVLIIATCRGDNNDNNCTFIGFTSL